MSRSTTTMKYEIGCFAYMAVILFAINMAACGGAIGSGLRAIGAGLESPCVCECDP